MMNIISKGLNRSTKSFILTGSRKKVNNQLEKLFLIQSKNICHKDDLDPDQVALRLPPFPYKEKRVNFFHHHCKLEGFHPTLGKFTENTKVLCIEGNVGAGKEVLGKKLAELMGMEYYPDVNAEMDYRFSDGFDYRDLNVHLHEDVRYPDFRSVLETRNPYQAGAFELYLLRMKSYNYLNALTHLLNTGDGVIIEKSPWSHTVFARTAKDINLVSQDYLTHYWEVRSNCFAHMLRPHVIIYLDVPIDKCLENARLKNTHGIADLIDEDYLELVEKNYKNHFLPLIEKHAELFTYKLTQPVTEETVNELSEIIVDELSESDMDEYLMNVTAQDEKFEDWREFDSDKRLNDLRVLITRDKSEARKAFEFYPYYIDELWPSYPLLQARQYVTSNALEKREQNLAKELSWKERIFGKKMTYLEQDAAEWFIKTGYPPDHLQADN